VLAPVVNAAANTTLYIRCNLLDGLFRHDAAGDHGKRVKVRSSDVIALGSGNGADDSPEFFHAAIASVLNSLGY
jgi:hypothetical protein